MSAEGSSRRERFFHTLVSLATGRPWVVLGGLVALMLVGVYFGTGIELSTSRYSMVRRDDPYQARMEAFFERYGYPDALVFVIRGGDPDTRRAAAAALVDRGEADPDFQDRVLGRLDAEHLAEALFLFDPAVLESLGEMAGDRPLAALLEAGLPGIVGAVHARLGAALDGELDTAEADDPGAGLGELAQLASLLDDRLAGHDLRLRVAELAHEARDSEEGEGGGARAPPWVREGVDDAGFLTSRGGDFLIVAFMPRVLDAQMSVYAPLVERARAYAAEIEDEVGGEVEIMLTGLPVLMLDEDELVARGLFQSGLGTGIGVFLILALAYRSIRQSIMALIPIGVGMGMALGATALLYGELNPVTSAMFAVMLGLGIDFSVHLIGRYHECLRAKPDDRLAAVRASLVQAGPGIVTGALTTALAFLSVATAEFTAYAELGTVVALGLMLMLGCVLVLVPIFATWRFVPDRAPPVLPGSVGITRAVRGAGVPFLVVAVILGVWGAANFNRVQFNYRYLDFLPQSVASSEALHVIEADGAMNPMMAYLGADDIEAARGKATALRRLDAVGEVQSPSDLLPDLGEDDRLARLRVGLKALGPRPDFDRLADRPDRSGAALAAAAKQVVDDLDEIAFALEQAGRSAKEAKEARAAFEALRARAAGFGDEAEAEARIGEVEAQLAELLRRAWGTAEAVAARGHYEVDDLPPVFRHRHAALDDSGKVALFVIPRELVWSEQSARGFADAVTGVDPDAAGHAISMHVHNTMIIHDFRRAAVIAALIVLVVLLIDFRRLDDTLLAMVPVTVGWLWMILILALVPVTLNLANIVVLPLVLGVGLDAGVHMVHRCRQSADEARQGSGGDARATLEDLLQGTGASVILASVTTMVGFAGLIIPDHGGMRSLGLTMVLGTGCCLVATVLVLPALLVLLGRAR